MFRKLFLILSVGLNLNSGFDKSRIVRDVTYKSASVLPYAYNEKDQKVYFLFGKLKGGKDYVDFGRIAQNKHKNNPTWIAAAALEKDAQGLFGDFNKIKDQLQKAKENTEIYKIIDRDIVLFLLKVNFIENINDIFSKLEKPKDLKIDQLDWVSADELFSALRLNLNFVTNLDEDWINLKPKCTAFLKAHAFNTIKAIKDCYEQIDADDESKFEE